MKILKGYERVCLYCGKDIDVSYDEYTPYYACDCDDAKKVREIEIKISELKKQLPKPKYTVESKMVLIKK